MIFDIVILVCFVINQLFWTMTLFGAYKKVNTLVEEIIALQKEVNTYKTLLKLKGE